MTEIETQLGNHRRVCPWGEGRAQGEPVPSGLNDLEERSQVTAQKPDAPPPGSGAPGLRPSLSEVMGPLLDELTVQGGASHRPWA